MKQPRTNLDEYAKMGLAAMLPGMKFMLELMTQAYEEKRDLLALMQETVGDVVTREKKAAALSGEIHGGWPSDPVARSAEMKRRRAVAKAKRGGVPLEAVQSKIQKQRWAQRTPAERAAWVAKVQEGKRKAAAKRQRDKRAAAKSVVVRLEQSA